LASDSNVAFAAVGHVSTDENLLAEYAAKEYWPEAELFVDPSDDRALYSALGAQRVSLVAAVFDPRATASIVLSFLTRGALSTSVDGDGQQLGATYVLERGTGRVLYAHRQAHTGDEPDGAQIVRAVESAWRP
jgi:hypothetical protein